MSCLSCECFPFICIVTCWTVSLHLLYGVGMFRFVHASMHIHYSAVPPLHHMIGFTFTRTLFVPLCFWMTHRHIFHFLVPGRNLAARFATNNDHCWKHYNPAAPSRTYVPPAAAFRHTQYDCQNQHTFLPRVFPYTALTDWFCNPDGQCLLRGTDWSFNCIIQANLSI